MHSVILPSIPCLHPPDEGLVYYTFGTFKSWKSLRLNPRLALAYYNRGLAHAAQGDLQGEVSDYTKTIQLNPQHTSAYQNRGEQFFELGDYRAALTDFEQADQLRPDFNMTRGGLAITHHVLGNIPEAQRIWRELIAKNARFRDTDWVREELNWAEPLVDEARKLIAGL